MLAGSGDEGSRSSAKPEGGRHGVRAQQAARPSLPTRNPSSWAECIKTGSDHHAAFSNIPSRPSWELLAGGRDEGDATRTTGQARRAVDGGSRLSDAAAASSSSTPSSSSTQTHKLGRGPSTTLSQAARDHERPRLQVGRVRLCRPLARLAAINSTFDFVALFVPPLSSLRPFVKGSSSPRMLTLHVRYIAPWQSPTRRQSRPARRRTTRCRMRSRALSRRRCSRTSFGRSCHPSGAAGH